jgi:MazG family protein
MSTSLPDALLELVRIVAKLRDPNGGCPWDLEQTHDSLTPYVVEEAYEVVDAIKLDRPKLKDELGDLLLQVVLHAQIASEEKTFTLEEVIQGISKKLVYRHPHVFGDTKVTGTNEVLNNWEQLKQKELPKDKSILDGVPRSMPALLRAQRLGDKAARVGFDWKSADDVLPKVAEELREIAEATDKKAQDEELGDLLFVLVQWARKSGRTAEEVLSAANDKFTRRFKEMERSFGQRSISQASNENRLSDLSQEELEALWNEAKKVVG